MHGATIKISVMPCSVHSTFIGQRLTVILYVALVIASFLSWFYYTKYGVQHISTLHIDIDIFALTAIGLTPGGSSTVHIYIQTIHRTTQLTTLAGRLSGIRTQSGQTKIS
jgi:uncharacterized integral membrane protein